MVFRTNVTKWMERGYWGLALKLGLWDRPRSTASWTLHREMVNVGPPYCEYIP